MWGYHPKVGCFLVTACQRILCDNDTSFFLSICSVTLTLIEHLSNKLAPVIAYFIAVYFTAISNYSLRSLSFFSLNINKQKRAKKI